MAIPDGSWQIADLVGDLRAERGKDLVGGLTARHYLPYARAADH